MGFHGFYSSFNLFNIIFVIMFVLVMGTFAVGFVRGISTWSKNNHSPRLTVAAELVSRRTNVSRHHHSHAGDTTGLHDSTSTSTTYYVTFQVESGDRMEFRVTGSQYGLLVEGDKGKLTFQGTRYLSFERTL